MGNHDPYSDPACGGDQRERRQDVEGLPAAIEVWRTHRRTRKLWPMKLPHARAHPRRARWGLPGVCSCSSLLSPRSCLLLAAILLGGCAHERATPVLAGQVRVDVTDVAYDHSTGTHYLVLEEKSGRRVLPITIGDDEARAILFELHGIKPERPLTYELLLKVIEQTGNHVDRVLIGEVREEVYYAKVYLDHGQYELDSRPSDAVALAIGANAPIFVADRLLQTATPESVAPTLNT